MNFKDNLIGIRDKSMLLIGFAGGLRRSELSGLDCEDIEWTPYGVRLHLKKSKSNQEGKEETVDITEASNKSYCPVAALKDWLFQSKNTEGALFRGLDKKGNLRGRISTYTIALKAKWLAEQCGLDKNQFGGHSLRSGCATYLLEKKIPIHIVSRHLRHKKIDTTLQYDRNSIALKLKGIY